MQLSFDEEPIEAHAGVHTLVGEVTMETTGSQDVTTDTGDWSITGTQTVTVEAEEDLQVSLDDSHGMGLAVICKQDVVFLGSEELWHAPRREDGPIGDDERFAASIQSSAAPHRFQGSERTRI